MGVFRKIPSGYVPMNPVHESGIISHLRGKGTKKVTDSLLMFDIDVKIPNHDKTALSPDIFSSTTELTGDHVPFHDIDPLFCFTFNSRHFIKADKIILTDTSSLAGCIIHKHLCNSCLSSTNQMRIGASVLSMVILQAGAMSLILLSSH